MSLPVERILWAPTNSAHENHLHVVGDPRFTGTPPPDNPGMSDAVWAIYVALSERFGAPAYFLDADGSEDWTHMGWYNRRYIGGTTIWSQHAYSNALDIGPYYGVEEQKRFYDFLTGKEEEVVTRGTAVDSGNPSLEDNFESQVAKGVMSKYTQPGGVAFNDEIATFNERLETYILKRVAEMLRDVDQGTVTVDEVIDEMVQRLDE